MKEHNIFLMILFIIMFSSLCFAENTTPPNISTDILLIYSSGIPHITISDIKPDEFDGVSCPTPEDENMRTVSEKLAAQLQKKNLKVSIIEAGKVKNRIEIINARLVIIGSPSYFGNVSWPVKKFLDEIFGEIYASVKGRLNKKRIAAFSMAEIVPSANSTLNAIKQAVHDCQGTFGSTMIITTKYSKKEVKEQITAIFEIK